MQTHAIQKERKKQYYIKEVTILIAYTKLVTGRKFHSAFLIITSKLQVTHNQTSCVGLSRLKPKL